MSEAVIALALLKTNWDLHHASYIDNFNLLTAECLRQSQDDVISGPALQAALRSRFGLNLPAHSVEVLLRRAKKQGFVERQHGVYRPRRDKLATLEVAAQREHIVRAQEEFSRGLQEYAKQSFDLLWTTEDTEQALHTYLSGNQLELLKSAEHQVLLSLPKRSSKSQRFVFAKYVNSLIETNAPQFESFQLVVEGNLLANALFLPDPGSVNRNFHKTRIYFDTRFLIHALGYTGESLQAPARELLSLLYETGADLRCFDHTIDEVKSILTGVAANLGSHGYMTGYGMTFDYFMSKGFSESDVHLLAARLEQDLETLRVSSREPPEDDSFRIDETELQAEIETEPRATGSADHLSGREWPVEAGRHAAQRPLARPPAARPPQHG